MVFRRRINGSADLRDREDAARMHIVSAAADLDRRVFAEINGAYMKVRFRNRITGQDFSRDYIRNVAADLVAFLNLEAAGEKLFFQYFRGHIDINIIF